MILGLRVSCENAMVDIKADAIKNWLITPPAPDQKTMKERFLAYFEEKKVNNFIDEVIKALDGQDVKIQAKTAFIKAIK